MIAMPMSNDGAIHWLPWVYMEAPSRAVEPGIREGEKAHPWQQSMPIGLPGGTRGAGGMLGAVP